MYAWDEEVGLFIPFSPVMKAVIDKISSQKSMSKEKIIEQLKDIFDYEEISFCYDWLMKWRKIKSSQEIKTPEKFSIPDIKRHLLKRGLSQLILAVTEDCNFGCKYCIYSDMYEYTRSHSNRNMDFATAKKAIDYYFSLINEGKRYHPMRMPTIGFYGGEPLLNFELIKKCFEYIAEKYHDYEVLYGLTTNGSLLDAKKADWLIKHNFSISLSLDGPEEEHNRNRIYRNGKGTFKDVMKNIDPIMEQGYENIVSLPVFDWKSNFFKNEEFFNKENIPQIANISQVNEVEWGRYYGQFTDEDRRTFLERLKRASDYYFEKLDYKLENERSSYLDRLVGDPRVDDLLSSFSVYSRENSIMPFTGACVPGTKIFVDVDGYFHACERITDAFSIGNVDDGLNFEKISQLIYKYIIAMDKCSDCKSSRKCSLCYTHFMTEGGFTSSSKACERVEIQMRTSFIETFTIAEKNPDILDARSKYMNIKKYYGD